MEAQVRFENVSFRYPEDDSGRDVFADVTLDLPRGVISLIGKNGSEKTTFLMLAGGVLVPKSGKVHLRGSNFAGLQDEE
jgi:ATP-binding cassette subfamily B protein